MGMNSNQQYTWMIAENNSAANCAMSADAFYPAFFTAIIPLMAVLFIVTVCNHLAFNIIISIILGVIILMVRGRIKPMSRTR